ncbi:hypothetical protein DOU02_06725 [Clavibacter michiganensis subsp. michiganensis]|uniref:hypothetical protein n=1 Tax=Clavibacter michiganensis TaxID=28447 RepID=UPI001303BB1C|nr:hypothetical protein [Clavibacter michiganensis]KAF0258772.1 hypothetical protein DOU02_06725 [Clavibacter michiganensis subsp. michiganensis]
MAKDISIDLIADASGVVRAAKQSSDALGDVADSLDDLVRDSKDAGKKSGDGIDKGITAGAKDADREVEKLTTTFKDVADNAKKAGKDSGDGIKDNIKRGTDSGKESLKDFGSEANSTAKESTASFDGSAESIIGSVQEIAANAPAAFGAVAAGAGLAIAAIIGVAVQAGVSAAEAQAEAKARTQELAQELYDLDGDVSKLDIGQKVRDWFGEDNLSQQKAFFEAADTNFETASKYAERLGLNVEDVISALSGFDPGARNELIKLSKEMEKSGELSEGQANLLRELQGDLGNTGDALGMTAEQYEVMTAVSERWTEQSKAAAAAEERHTDAINTLQSGIDDAIGSFDEYAATKDKAADPQAYINGIAEQIAATQNFSSNVEMLSEKFGLSVDETQALIDQGVNFGPMLQQIIDSGLDASFIEQFTKGVGGGQEILDGADLNGTVAIDADVDAAAQATDEEAAREREGEIVIEANSKPFAADMKKLTDANYKTDIDVALRGMNEIERRYAAIKDKTVTITFANKETGRVPAP